GLRRPSTPGAATAPAALRAVPPRSARDRAQAHHPTPDLGGPALSGAGRVLFPRDRLAGHQRLGRPRATGAGQRPTAERCARALSPTHRRAAACGRRLGPPVQPVRTARRRRHAESARHAADRWKDTVMNRKLIAVAALAAAALGLGAYWWLRAPQGAEPF